MKHKFTAAVWQEDIWFVAHCNEVEIASQGKTQQEAIDNLREAIELHFEEPVATLMPSMVTLEAEVYDF